MNLLQPQHSKSIRLFILSATLMVITSGCKTLTATHKSSIISEPVSNKLVGKGVMYATPRQDLIFTFERKKISKKILTDEVTKKKKGVSDIEEIQTKQKATLDFTKKELMLATSDDSKAKLKLEVALLELELAVLKENYLIASGKLNVVEKELLDFTLRPNRFQDSIKLSASDPYPDYKHRFRATINENWFTSETVDIKTTEGGLLSGGTTKSEGQLDEIIISTISSISALKNPPSATITGQKSKIQNITSYKKNSKCPNPPKEETFQYIVNLDDPNWEKHLSDSLSNTSFCYKISIVTPLSNVEVIKQVTKEMNQIHDGLVYPRQASFQFNIHDKETSNYIDSVRTIAIDPTAFSFISLDKGKMVTNEYEFEFSNGMLTRYKAIKPNGLLTVLSLPVDLAKAIVSVPAEILQFKIDYSSKEEAYLRAEEVVKEAKNGIFYPAIEETVAEE